MCFALEAEADVRYQKAVSLTKLLLQRCIMIKITDEAKEKLQGTIERNPGKYFRIFIKGIG